MTMSRDHESTGAAHPGPGRVGTGLDRLLLQQGIITDEEYTAAMSQSEQEGHSIWSALRGLNVFLSPRGPSGDRAGAGSAAWRSSDWEHPTSIPRLVSELFEDTVRWGATDLHLDPGSGGVTVRARIDGLLHTVGTLPEEVARHVRSRIKVLAGIDLLERREPQDGHISLQAEEGRRDFRVATLMTGAGERLVVRFHQVADRRLALDALGLEDGQAEALGRLLERPQGLILVAGPIGSGKTTTLYACLQALNVPTRSLVTIEDPIEYRLDGVNQVEVHRHLGLTFARGLRAILRQDPDIIMVGEIRDRDTARIASRAAATGAVVFSSLHAADGPGVFRTLANFRVSPHRIGECLAGIVVQRLVRTLCGACKRPAAADPSRLDVLAGWGLGGDESAGATLFDPVGCPQCLGTGYHGRIGIFDVIEIDDHARDQMARDVGAGRWPLSRGSGRAGALHHAAALKVGRGLTTIEEVRRVLPRRSPAPADPRPREDLTTAATS